MSETVATAGLCTLIDARLRQMADADGVSFDEMLERGQRYGVGRVAQRAGMSERALWRIYHERDRVDVYTADRLLAAIGHRLGDLRDYSGCDHPEWASGISCELLTVADDWSFR
jgi:hypothetical protein